MRCHKAQCRNINLILNINIVRTQWSARERINKVIEVESIAFAR